MNDVVTSRLDDLILPLEETLSFSQTKSSFTEVVKRVSCQRQIFLGRDKDRERRDQNKMILLLIMTTLREGMKGFMNKLHEGKKKS